MRQTTELPSGAATFLFTDIEGSTRLWERGEPRFAMLETIHEYARERLRERTDAGKTHRRHAGYFLTLPEESEPRLGGPEQVAWFERLETENDNLRAAISWAIGHGEAELGLRLAQALRPFWYARGRYVEGRGWVARFLGDLGELFVDAEDYARAQYLYEEVLVLSRQMDDASTLVECLTNSATSRCSRETTRRPWRQVRKPWRCRGIEATQPTSRAPSTAWDGPLS